MVIAIEILMKFSDRWYSILVVIYFFLVQCQVSHLCSCSFETSVLQLTRTSSTYHTWQWVLNIVIYMIAWVNQFYIYFKYIKLFHLISIFSKIKKMLIKWRVYSYIFYLEQLYSSTNTCSEKLNLALVTSPICTVYICFSWFYIWLAWHQASERSRTSIFCYDFLWYVHNCHIDQHTIMSHVNDRI